MQVSKFLGNLQVIQGSSNAVAENTNHFRDLCRSITLKFTAEIKHFNYKIRILYCIYNLILTFILKY
jgi:hypothetical protein